jgi:hypothetical protein
MNYQFIAVVVFLVLLLVGGIALIVDAGVRVFRNIQIGSRGPRR